MTYTKDIFRQLFKSKFDLTQWQSMLTDYFHADKIRQSPEMLEEKTEECDGYYLGEMTTRDNYRLGFFYYKMKDVSVLRRKVGLRHLIKPYLKLGFDAAMVVFSDDKYWRLSLICDLTGDATNAKRFTYVFGDGQAFYKTPTDRFYELQKSADSFQAIRDTFSVEALSDDFFDNYRLQYAEFVKYLTGKIYVKKANNKWVEITVGEPDPQFFSSFGGDDKLVRDYVKKMMGRIVFLYFLQSKGWLAGNYHYMHDLFYNSKVQDDFLDKVLEPMFFGLLNTKPEDRSTAPLINGVGVKYVPHADQIPYLNGGLFQQEDIDKVDSCFPSSIFKELFDFFESYNFTIDENDPNDAEVGVDPEMLGKIFENLLEDNKDKGVFYTPKEIVKYMCQESLIAYLQTDESDETTKEKIANFVKTYNADLLGGASSELASRLDQRLIDVKICDPAIGSGAFPMGLLRELYACRKAIEIFDADNAADIKRHIIQNNIYGVDIEKGAVDIARLRFWLALIIDEKEPMPLPNLDFKIMQGNSLLESYKGIDLSKIKKGVREGRSKKNSGVLSLSFDENDDLTNIQRLVEQYFDITDHQKRDECRNQISHYIKDYIKKCGPAIADEVDKLEIPNNQFFLWHTYFADVFEKGGFDIVIGNPPYIRVQNLSHKIIDTYKHLYHTAWKRIDISTLFFEQMSKFLSNNGILCYISSNQFLSAEYGRLMRRFLIQKNLISKIIDFGDLPVFKNATTYVSIFFVSSINKNLFYYHKVPSLPFVEPQNYKTCKYDDFNDEAWSFVFSEKKLLLNRLQKMPMLKDVAFAKGGIISGNDACYLFNKSICPFENEVSLDIIRTDDISRYHIGESKLKIFYPCYLDSNGGTSVIDLDEIQNKYPKAFLHITSHELELKKRKDSRFVMGDKKHWYQPVRFGTLKLFNNIKILGPGIAKHNKFVLDEHGYAYSFGNIYGIVAKNKKTDMRIMLGILNSKLIEFYLHCIAPLKRGGYFSYGSTILEKIPFKYPDTKLGCNIHGLVSDILTRKKDDMDADTSALEDEIDFLVYHLYDLTYDEVLIVDPNPPFTREEYDAYKVEQ